MLLALLLACREESWQTFGLLDPVRVADKSGLVDTEHGHAVPLMADVDGDGRPELLVGQFEGGKLRVYKDSGDRTAHTFTTFEWLQAADADASVPYG